MPTKKKEEQESEKMISMYDPAVDAYREVPVSLAKKFIQSAKEVEQKLEKEKNG